MEEPEFKLYDLVVCTETGSVGVIVELRSITAVVEFPVGARSIEYLDIEILGRDALVHPSWYNESRAFRGSWINLS